MAAADQHIPGIVQRPRWLGPLALGGVAGMLALLACTQIKDPDFWWQRAVGRAIWEHGLPVTERWMHTRLGKPVITASWGYCAALDQIDRVIGESGLVVLKVLALVGAMAAAAWAAVRRAPVWAVAAAGWVAVMVASQRLVMRPEVVTYLLLGLMMLVLDRAGTRRALWGALIVAVWVNVHSTFVIGLGLVGAWWVGRIAGEVRARLVGDGGAWEWQRVLGPTGVLALAGLASLANPYGYQVWAIPVRRMVALFGAEARAGTAVMVIGPIAAAGAMAAAVVMAPMVGARARRWWGGVSERARRRWVMGWRVGWRAVVIAAAIGGAAAAWSGAGRAIERGGGVAEASLLERELSGELATPWMLRGEYVAAQWFFVLAAGAVVGVVLVPRRVGVVASAAAVIGLVMGVLAVRALGVAAVGCVPALAVGIAAVVEWLARRARVPVGGAAGAVCVIVLAACAWRGVEAVTDRFWVKQGDSARFGVGVHPDADLGAVVEVVRRAGAGVRLFNGEKTGSQLMAAGLPVFMDSRMFDGILTGYVRAMRDAEVFERVVDRQRIGVAVIDTADVDVIRRLHGQRERWRLVDMDHRCAVFFRAGVGAGVPTLRFDGAAVGDPGVWSLDGARRRGVGLRAVREGGVQDRAMLGRAVLVRARVHLGRALAEVGGAAAALTLLEEAAALDPDRFGDWALVGSLRRGAGDAAGARAAYGRGAERGDPDAMLLLALGHAERGECAAALAWLERADERRRLGGAGVRLAAGLARACGDDAARARWTARQAESAEPGR